MSGDSVVLAPIAGATVFGNYLYILDNESDELLSVDICRIYVPSSHSIASYEHIYFSLYNEPILHTKKQHPVTFIIRAFEMRSPSGT